ncbi:MAG: hypothetical protein NTW06_04180, partial [Candidatus Falkowbacteria bacterium]|nr:hypothetical protein [Candidatus Falkowbacteria bacterium]
SDYGDQIKQTVEDCSKLYRKCCKKSGFQWQHWIWHKSTISPNEVCIDLNWDCVFFGKPINAITIKEKEYSKREPKLTKKIIKDPDLKDPLKKGSYSYLKENLKKYPCLKKEYHTYISDLNIEFFSKSFPSDWNTHPESYFLPWWREKVGIIKVPKLWYTWLDDKFNFSLKKIEKEKLNPKFKAIHEPKGRIGSVYRPFRPYCFKVGTREGYIPRVHGCYICSKPLVKSGKKGRPTILCGSDSCKDAYDVERKRRSRKKEKQYYFINDLGTRISYKNVVKIGLDRFDIEAKFHKQRWGDALGDKHFEFGNQLSYIENVNVNYIEQLDPDKITKRVKIGELNKEWVPETGWYHIKNGDEIPTTLEYDLWKKKCREPTTTQIEMKYNEKYGDKFKKQKTDSKLPNSIERYNSTDTFNDFIFEKYYNYSTFENAGKNGKAVKIKIDFKTKLWAEFDFNKWVKQQYMRNFFQDYEVIKKDHKYIQLSTNSRQKIDEERYKKLINCDA